MPRLKVIDAGVEEEYSLRFDDAPFGRLGVAVAKKGSPTLIF